MEDEIIVQTDAAGLAELESRWGALVLATASAAGLPGLEEDILLLRIDPSSADVSGLPGSLRRLSDTATGDHSVSSAAGHSLLAAAAEEAAAGGTVGFNFVATGSTPRGETHTEHPSGAGIPEWSYTPSSHLWPNLSAGGAQTMDVVGAWRDLAIAYRLDDPVSVMIFDMGFVENGEYPPLAARLSQVPDHAATGQRNISGCGSSPCPFHGQSVASTAFGMPDDYFGGAGPAGPVVNPMVLFTLYDYFSVITALIVAADQGARVVNMSYGAPVPSAFDWTVLPGRLATAAAASAGALLFAAAGNADDDVDGESCIFDLCREHTFYTPCENEGVICIGALGWNTTLRAGFSNWGEHDVDLWAPGVLPVGPDPDNAGARVVQGTSMSSPFAAGVAALVVC